MQYNTSCPHRHWYVPFHKSGHELRYVSIHLYPQSWDQTQLTTVLRDCGSKKSDPPHPKNYIVVSHLDISRNQPSILGWQSFWPVIHIIFAFYPLDIPICLTSWTMLTSHFLGEICPGKPWTPWAKMAWTRPTCRKRRATHPHSWSSSCNSCAGESFPADRMARDGLVLMVEIPFLLSAS